MTQNQEKSDRYISFCNIDCDQNADRIIAMLESNLNAQNGAAQWLTYFNDKRQQQLKRGHDNLHFVGNQLNMLYEYFRLCEDEAALELLYQVEQECC